MADTTVVKPQPKRRGWLRKLAWIGGIFVVLLVVTYFVVTSGAFFKGVILPKVGAAMNAKVTASDASISPFSQVVVRDLQVQPNGAEPLFSAKEIRLRYSLMDILRGKINVDEITVESPTVKVIRQVDGTSNLDPILKASTGGQQPETAPPPSGSSQPPQVDLKKLAINNATLNFTQMEAHGGKTVTDIAGLNFSLENVKNGQPAKLAWGANFSYATGTATNLSQLAGAVKSGFQAGLGADLLPQQVQGNLDLGIQNATGLFADAAKLSAQLGVDLAPADIKQLALQFAREGKPLGAITAAGPLDILKQEGKLKIDVTGIGNEVLSLVGARYGILFGSTKLAATYDLELKNAAQQVITSGRITGKDFSLVQSNLATPVMDLQLDYGLLVDLPKSNATVRSFSFNANQAGRPFLKSGITREMILDWSKGAEAMEESTFEATISEFNLADWRALLGTNISAGVVSGTLNVKVQRAGKLVAFDLTSLLRGLAAQYTSNRIDRADLEFKARGQVADFTAANVAELGIKLTHAGQPVATLKGAGTYHLGTGDTDIQSEGEAQLPALMALAPQPDLALSAGSVKFTGRIQQKNLTPAQTNQPSLDQTVTGNLQLANLTGRLGSNVMDRVEGSADLALNVKDQLATIRECRGTLKQAGQTMATLTAAGSYHLQTGDADLQSECEAQLPALVALAPMPDLALSAGSVKFTGRIQQKNLTPAQTNQPSLDQGVIGNLHLANLTGRFSSNVFDRFETAADLAVNVKDQLATIRECRGTLKQAGQPGGTFDMTGSYHLTNEVGQLSLRLVDLNQHTLRSFLAAALGNLTLESASINANATARYDARGESSVKGDLSLTNLVVNDPAGKLPKTPLAASAQLDAGMVKQVVDLRRVQLALAPTARATNQMLLAGTVDMTRSNAITGNLKLTAESVDVTPWYDLYMGQTAPAATPPAPSGTPTPPSAEAELPAMVLPLTNFVLNTAIDRFYLREIVITNFIAATRIDGGQVSVKPVQLALNGAPVKGAADIDLGVPGYRYDVALSADRIPLEPLANSFSPDYRGRAQGDLIANLQIKGAGTTGASLQRNLTGAFGLAFTNANIQLVGAKTKQLVMPVALFLGLNELLESPLKWLAAQGQMGQGKVQVSTCHLATPAFVAGTHGEVALAAVLTNSALSDWGVDFALSRSLAEKAQKKLPFLGGNIPTNQAYVALPSFIKVAGTLGVPKTRLDEKALLTAGTQKLVDEVGKRVGGQSGQLIQNLGNIIPGLKSSSTNPPATTNQAPTSPSTTNKPAADPFKALNNLFGPGRKK